MMKNLPDKDLYRPEEVAKHFSVTVQTIYGWIGRGIIKDYVRVGGVIRIKRTEIIELSGIKDGKNFKNSY